MPYINLFISDETHAALKELAKERKQPMYQLIPELLAEATVKGEGQEPVAEPVAAVDFGVPFGNSRAAPKPGSGKTRGNPRKSAEIANNV